jgi:hypothetical protein
MKVLVLSRAKMLDFEGATVLIIGILVISSLLLTQNLIFGEFADSI